MIFESYTLCIETPSEFCLCKRKTFPDYFLIFYLIGIYKAICYMHRGVHKKSLYNQNNYQYHHVQLQELETSAQLKLLNLKKPKCVTDYA